ncbi:EVE domain-containing protein [Streptomyces sp. NPDC001401]|uniref:EVE domain-containing protein n=1 Tax=Streptomyces sp. NPDC001401 TaxID=3364570 RepID=UPI0036A22F9F
MASHNTWLGVASGDHVRDAVDLAIIQVNHGRRHNVARMRRGDGFVYYSPTQTYGSRTPLRAFTALGVIADDEPYLADEAVNMGSHGTRRPWRRRIDYVDARSVDLRDVTHQLHLTQDRNWGYRLRLGCIQLAVEDFEVLYDAMTTAPAQRRPGGGDRPPHDNIGILPLEQGARVPLHMATPSDDVTCSDATGNGVHLLW